MAFERFPNWILATARRLVAFLALCFASSAASQPPHPQLKTLCATVEGRKTLRAESDPGTLFDWKEQAAGMGVEPEAHIQAQIDALCSFMGVPLQSTPSGTDGGVPNAPDAGTQVQSWSFEYDPTKLVPMGTTYVWPWVRCASCQGTMTMKLPAPELQVCRLSFKSKHISKWVPGSLAGAQLILRPAHFVNGASPSAFQGFSVEGRAQSGSSIELTDVTVYTIPLSASAAERESLGCIKPETNPVWKVGQAECTEDRSGFRYSDQCKFTHLAVGSSMEIRRETMRKVIVSKPAGSGGEDRVILSIAGGGPVKEYVLTPGSSYELLSKSGAHFTDARVQITTEKLGANGTSEIQVMTEWSR